MAGQRELYDFRLLYQAGDLQCGEWIMIHDGH